MVTRLVAVSGILLFLYLALMFLLSQMGGAGFWETIKESGETVAMFAPVLAVVGGLLYLVAVALTGSWSL